MHQPLKDPSPCSQLACRKAAWCFCISGLADLAQAAGSGCPAGLADCSEHLRATLGTRWKHHCGGAVTSGWPSRVQDQFANVCLWCVWDTVTFGFSLVSGWILLVPHLRECTLRWTIPWCYMVCMVMWSIPLCMLGALARAQAHVARAGWQRRPGREHWRWMGTGSVSPAGLAAGEHRSFSLRGSSSPLFGFWQQRWERLFRENTSSRSLPVLAIVELELLNLLIPWGLSTCFLALWSKSQVHGTIQTPFCSVVPWAAGLELSDIEARASYLHSELTSYSR